MNIKFNNQRLLKEALTHRSFLNENKTMTVSNERLEFLGDAILSFVVSEWLFQKFPEIAEGTLTNLRSNLVKTKTLSKIARQINLGEDLLLSKGEEKSGGRQNSVLLANTLEAIIGALYFDQGMKAVKDFIFFYFEPHLTTGSLKDAKSLLQEIAQNKYTITPTYRTINSIGPDHEKIFTVGVYFKKQLLAKAVGKSKQEAEEAAAQNALEIITVPGYNYPNA